MTYHITNSTYGSKANITGKLDLGVNFAVSDVNLLINDTTNNVVDLDSEGNFTFGVNGRFNVGTYNITVQNESY